MTAAAPVSTRERAITVCLGPRGEASWVDCAMRAPGECARLPSGDHCDNRLVIAELRNVCSWLETVWQHP